MGLGQRADRWSVNVVLNKGPLTGGLAMDGVHANWEEVQCDTCVMHVINLSLPSSIVIYIARSPHELVVNGSTWLLNFLIDLTDCTCVRVMLTPSSSYVVRFLNFELPHCSCIINHTTRAWYFVSFLYIRHGNYQWSKRIYQAEVWWARWWCHVFSFPSQWMPIH